jgi:hypothetical protein
LIDVILVKNKGTVIRYEVAKHACENTAVKAYKKRNKAPPMMQRGDMIRRMGKKQQVYEPHGSHHTERCNSPFLCRGVSLVQDTSSHSVASISFPFFALYSSLTH